MTTSDRSPAADLLATREHLDVETLDRLVPLVYEELREMAHRKLAGERDDSLQTTGLVHETYLKLADGSSVTRRGRAYFFAAASRAMRHILVDRARRRLAGKRGGGARLVTLDDGHAAIDSYASELLDLHEALQRLAEHSPRQARVVELRFFGGMTVEETALALDISARTVDADWALARAWLFRMLGGRTDILTAEFGR